MALSVPLSRFTSRVGGGSAFFVRQLTRMAIGNTIGVLQALLTPMIAVTTTYIAYRQYRMSRDAKALELYDRRLRIYRATLAILDYIRRGNAVDFDRYADWSNDVAEADFLFGHEVSVLLDSLTHAVGDCLEDSKEQRLDTASAHAALRVDSYYHAIRETFAPYLRPTFQSRYPMRRLSPKRVEELIVSTTDKPVTREDDTADVPF